MASQLSSLAAILFSTAFFLMGNGLIGTLNPLRAHLEGFSDVAVGVLGAFYFTGFVAGCFAGPGMVARAGHIRAFAVAAAMNAVCLLLQAMWTEPWAWFSLRALTGVSNAVLFMTIESWLNDRASNETRGRILSTYVIVNLSALVAGQWFLLVSPPQSFEPFSIGALLYCLCIMPIGLTRLAPPQASPMPRLRLKGIFGISPVGAAGCLTVGLANGAFWTLAPVYAQSLGFGTGQLALFMTVFIAGGALVQWPLGRISDGLDRRWVIAATCMAASLCGLILGLQGAGLLLRAPFLFYAVVFALGSAMLPLYSLSIAHANDRLPRAQFVEASAGLLLINAAASIPGPLLGAFAMANAGPASLFLYTALAHAAMAFYAFSRIRVKGAAPASTRDAFNALPQGSPASLPLDPRGPEQVE